MTQYLSLDDTTVSSQKERKSMSFTVAKKNRVIGTPDYIPPEVINGESANNPSIDWWSLGVMTYEFIVGIP
jgi:serine/threonine protein kinase